MAHAITLSDGTTTVDLYATASGIFFTAWEFLGGGSEPTVGESIEVLVRAASSSALQTAVRDIEKLLTGAERRERTRRGARVWLTVQFDGEASAWRSEVLAGKLELTQAPDQWGQLKIAGVLAVTRRNWWEGPQAELELSANGQAAATGGRSVTNHSDNWVQIAAAQVTGAVPAPAYIELTNSAGGNRSYYSIHIANNFQNDPANFTHILQGEAATGASTVASGTSSGGNVGRITVNTTGTLTWSLASAAMQDASGGRFVLLARIAALSGTLSVRPQIKSSAGTILWQAHEPMTWGNTGGTQLAVGNVIPLPPGGWDASWGDANLVLTLTSAASVVLDLDFLQLFPADSYRLLTLFAENVANGAAVRDNPIDGYAGVYTSSAVQATVSPRGNPIMLYPGVLQRLYILQTQDTACTISDTFTVRVYFRPRRLTL